MSRENVFEPRISVAGLGGTSRRAVTGVLVAELFNSLLTFPNAANG